MRIRNLNPKPTTFTGNPLMRTRWKTIYRNGDGCFTVNSGNNKRNGLDADFIRTTTSFDIIANSDISISSADVAPWITGLPDGQVCFICDVEPLQDINVMMQAHGQTYKNKDFNVCSGIVKASGVPGSRIVVSAACRHQLDNRNCATVRFASDAEPDTDVARVWGVAIVTGKEKEIMDLLNVGAFTALTAPYAAVPDGGGVFLLALIVLIGGWRHENTESMAGPALRKQGQHLECDTGIRHHSEERRLLGIHLSQWRILHPGSEVRMHDDAAQPAQLMGLHTAGAGGYAAHGEWGLRHGHHQRRNKGYYWHPCACRHQDHSDGHVRRRSGRMADPAGGGSARLRSRHRTILNVPGVAA